MILLKNVIAVGIEPASVKEGIDIAIDGTEIIAVGQQLANQYPQAQVKDLQGKLVMPGIVCSHNHFYSGLARGIMADIQPCPDFVSTLKNLWWRLDRALDEEMLYYSGLVCAIEAIKNGCTAVIDHHASPKFIKGSLSTLRKAFLKTGLRGMTCYETTDRNLGLQELEAGVEENIAFAQSIDADRIKQATPYLVEAHIGAHAPFTVSDAGLSLLKEAIDKTKRGLHIHVAEDGYDVSHSHHHYSKDVVVRLDDAGLVGQKTLLGHGLFLSDADIAILNDKDGFLVHNARSNMNNHVGYNQQLTKFKNVALGTDGIGADMFEELKFAFFKHRDAGGALWPDSFLRFLANGNILLERNFNAKFGQLKKGYKADLTICDYMSPTPFEPANLPGHFAFGMSANSVHSVMVEGRFVYENHTFTWDISPVYAEAKKLAKKMWQAMDQLPR